jgi:hypothetical protein
MKEIDTVKWYQEKLAQAAAAKAEAAKPIPPCFRCCGRLKHEEHDSECVNFQPEGETKTNRIVEHIPNFASGFDRRCVGFDTLEELMEIPWVKSWKESPKFYLGSARKPTCFSGWEELPTFLPLKNILTFCDLSLYLYIDCENL